VKDRSKVEFTSENTVSFDLVTSDNKRYEKVYHLYGSIVPLESTFKILGTKLEMTLKKADGLGWPVLKADDPHTGEIIQAGNAGRFEGQR
jgi:hypothetical protein